MNHRPLQNVCPASQVNSPHRAAVIQMLVPALEFLAALPQQSLAAFSTNAAAIGIHGLLFPMLAAPPLRSSLRLGAIGPHSRLRQPLAP